MHQPVMLAEVLTGLNLTSGDQVIDATLGGGGHTEALLQAIGPTGRLLGLDRDPASLKQAAERLAPYHNFNAINADFDQLESVATQAGWSAVQAILFDLGLSSLQLDDPTRGLSFQTEGPLDMRLNPTDPTTAAELIKRLAEPKLAELLYRYGELYDARRLAKKIVEARQPRPITTTQQLVAVLGLTNPGVKAKVFQAFRIAVNDELGQLERALPQAVSLLAPGGRLAVISFHSLEDRIVKQFLRHNHLMKPLIKKPLVPSPAELAANPRARSAKLRLAVKEK